LFGLFGFFYDTQLKSEFQKSIYIKTEDIP